MRIEIEKTLDIIDLGEDSGLRQRDIDGISAAGLGELSFCLYAEVDSDGGIDGIMVDTLSYMAVLGDISNALGFPFDLGGYKILTKAIYDCLENYAGSCEAEEAISNAYYRTLEGLEEDALCDRASA